MSHVHTYNTDIKTNVFRISKINELSITHDCNTSAVDAHIDDVHRQM